MKNRRSEPRFAAEQPVEVLITDSNDAVQCNGLISGFSRSGIMLQTPSAIRRGSDIKITWAQATVSGRVRYCRRRAPKTFHVGVKITAITNADGSPISPEATEIIPVG